MSLQLEMLSELGNKLQQQGYSFVTVRQKEGLGRIKENIQTVTGLIFFLNSASLSCASM
jgi:hypothetical protein